VSVWGCGGCGECGECGECGRGWGCRGWGGARAEGLRRGRRIRLAGTMRPHRRCQAAAWSDALAAAGTASTRRRRPVSAAPSPTSRAFASTSSLVSLQPGPPQHRSAGAVSRHGPTRASARRPGIATLAMVWRAPARALRRLTAVCPRPASRRRGLGGSAGLAEVWRGADLRLTRLDSVTLFTASPDADSAAGPRNGTDWFCSMVSSQLYATACSLQLVPQCCHGLG
jgi:hypothetical protein